LRLVLHRDIPENEILRRQWNELVEQMERPEVFYLYEWALAVARAYHDSVVPLLLLAYEGDSLVGLVALATNIAHQKISFLAGATADYCDFVCPPQRRPELIDAVLTELRRLNLTTLLLANLPADSATSRTIRLVARNLGYSVFSRPAYRCSQVQFSSREQRASIKQSVQRKQMLRRYLKAMEKTGPVALSHLKSWDRIATVLPRFAKAHVARFLATGRISNLARPERRVFLSELARLLSEQGSMTLTRLMMGDRPAAWNYGFQFAGSWFWYQPTFDSRLQQYSPGFCLLSKIVEEACDTPEIDRVDLGLGAEGYKERVATDSRLTVHVTVTTAAFAYWSEFARYHAAAAIKSVTGLETWVRRALSHTSSLRKRYQAKGACEVAGWFWRRFRQALFGRSEVLFFEWPPNGISRLRHATLNSLTLQLLDLDLLAVATMRYVDEPETLAYLLRSAARLDSEQGRGFALVTGEGVPVHFCWVTDFEGFYMSELDHKPTAPSPDSVMLFDCWTPDSVRGHGYYSLAISDLASQLWRSGKCPWIFSAAANISSVRGVEKAGFVRRFSLVRKRKLFLSKVVRSQSFMAAKPLANSSAAD
jgi:CelD/BcsL family acetyltransferase involved in cellulose biosynthesis